MPCRCGLSRFLVHFAHTLVVATSRQMSLLSVKGSARASRGGDDESVQKSKEPEIIEHAIYFNFICDILFYYQDSTPIRFQ